MDQVTATEASQRPDLYRETLEAQRVAQREHVRLEIVRETMRWMPATAMTASELVAAATTIEAFVVGGSVKAEPRTALEAARMREIPPPKLEVGQDGRLCVSHDLPQTERNTPPESGTHTQHPSSGQ